MIKNPILIIQLQRMGDLLLSFQLIKKLLYLEPDRPIWVVADPIFFRGLMPLAPKVTFFDWTMVSTLKNIRYAQVINLSHRPEAIDLAGVLDTDKRVGFFRKGPSVYIEGDWRVYRASIVSNNRHNVFHWADLEALGIVPPEIIQKIPYEPVRPIGTSGNVGLFIGASEPGKHPDAVFWGRLARYLIKQGVAPVFLGGPGDKALAKDAMAIVGAREITSFVGQFSIYESALFSKKLDVVITPDTGPMHLSAWVGTPIINLAMGNVNPRETGPTAPGHIVLCPAISCTGCWKCAGRNFMCRQLFNYRDVGQFILSILQNRGLVVGNCPSRLNIFQTERDVRGLFYLNSFGADAVAQPLRDLLGIFWREWFLSVLGGSPHNLEQASENLFRTAPYIYNVMKKEVLAFCKNISKALKKSSYPLPQGFLYKTLPVMRPYTGYIDLLLQNGEYSSQVLEKAVFLSSSFSKMFI